MCLDKIQILSKEYGELRFTLETDPESDPRDKSITLSSQGHYGLIQFRHMMHDDFNVWRHEFRLDHDMHISFQSPNPSISLGGVLKNNYGVNVEGLIPFTSKKFDYNICYTPSLNCEYTLKRGEYTIYKN